MYLSYYNLKAKPFQMSTDPAFLWLGEKHREALAVLKYAILENKGVLALTGDVGTGKTTLINALLNSLGEDIITATIYDPRLEVLDFFNTVAAAFQIEKTFEGKGKFILQFMEFLIKAHERNRKVLLIIDEAQGINEDLLEEIRLLSNLEAEYTRLLNIFFVGQNEFVDILQKYENRALRQRVTIRYHIDPLTLNETAAYITYRLKVAGTEAPVFDSGAIDEIFFFSSGYPRLINIMCDHALLSGYVREVQVINANLIRECREELLVSKKKAENNFQYTGNDHRSFPKEAMYSEPPPKPFIPEEDSHSYSEPPPEPFIPEEDSYSYSEPSPEPFIPDKDSYSYEDEQMVFGTWQPKSEREEPRKSSKKRFFRSPITIAFLLLVGIAAGYFFYSGDKNTAESFATLAQQQAKKFLSEKTESKNDKPPMVPSQHETSDIPNRVEADKGGDSRFFIEKSPNSGLLEEAVSKETETPQVVPSEQSPEESGVKTQTTKPLDTVPSDLRQKLPVIAPITEKTPDEFPVSAQMSKIESTSSSAAAVSSNIEKKKPVQVYAEPKVPETITTTPAKSVKKPEIGTSITEPTPSSVPSKKQATTLAAISLANPPKDTVVVKKNLPGKDQIVSTKKAQPATPVPDENKAVKGVDEKNVALRVPTSKSETAGSAAFTHINLDDRLKAFLNEYCRIYEQKDLDKFSSFFAKNAVEKGKPFRFWISKYRRNFDRIDSIEYDIKLERYATQDELGLVKISGIFHVRAKLGGSEEWRKSSGEISMVLEAYGNSFKVRQLDY